MRLIRNYVLSIFVGLLFLWLAFRGENWTEFWAHLEKVDISGVLGYLALFGLAHGLRIYRWSILVSGLGRVEPLKVFSIGAVGYMAIMVLPFRVGELVRPYLIRGQNGISASGAMATVVVERVIDGLIFVGLFFVFLSILPESGNPAVETVRYAAYVAGLVFGTALIVLIAGFYGREGTVRLFTQLLAPFPRALSNKLVSLLTAFLDGLVILPDIKRLAGFLGLTAIYWGALGWGMLIMCNAVGIPDVSIIGAFALLTVLTVGIMVPAGPGFTGTFELALKAGFALLIIPDSALPLITVYAVVLHICQLFIQVGYGIIFLHNIPVGLKGIFAGEDEALSKEG